MASEGAGKTHLVVRLLQRLAEESPQLRVAAHFAAAGGCGFHLARVALSHLALQLHSLLLSEAAEAAAAATAATAADAAAAVEAAVASLPARLPAAYAELSALCHRLIWALSRRGVPLLVVVDGLERLVPPLDANEDNEVGATPSPNPSP